MHASERARPSSAAECSLWRSLAPGITVGWPSGALVPLGLAIERVNVRGAAALGAASGLKFWLAPIPWVAPTRLRHGGLSWPLAVLILLGLAGYLALYWVAFTALLSRLTGVSRAGPGLVRASLCDRPGGSTIMVQTVYGHFGTESADDAI